MKKQLKHDFNRYKKASITYYGGSQMLSGDKQIRKCGCGIVAAADLFLYLHRHHEGCESDLFKAFDRQEVISTAEFVPIYSKLRYYFALIPNLGINGIMLALGINAFFLKYGYPYYARWGVLPSRLWSSIEEMLDNDIPVIITVGPDFPRIWQKHSASMYSDTAVGQTRCTKVRAHFMTLTALDEEWMYLSSWGKPYRIRRDEYEEFAKKYTTSIASNMMLICRL